MWTCPKCGTKVDSSFEVCWQCGTSTEGVEDPSFIRADEVPPIEDPLYDPIADPDPSSIPAAAHKFGPNTELVPCYQAMSLMEAKFLADQLTMEGIPALSDTQDMQDQLGALDGNPRVYCRGEDLSRARAWLEAYEVRRKTEHGHAE